MMRLPQQSDFIYVGPRVTLQATDLQGNPKDPVISAMPVLIPGRLDLSPGLQIRDSQGNCAEVNEI